MWLAPSLVDATVPMPANTPIPCLICRAQTKEPALTFAGTVKLAQDGRLEVFDGKTHQTMRFAVPPDFHGVDSSDGTLKDASVTSVKPGLLARVTYRSAGGHNAASRVLLLTINQCRALLAAERLSQAPSRCPD
jgi:hypothetical protein